MQQEASSHTEPPPSRPPFGPPARPFTCGAPVQCCEAVCPTLAALFRQGDRPRQREQPCVQDMPTDQGRVGAGARGPPALLWVSGLAKGLASRQERGAANEKQQMAPLDSQLQPEERSQQARPQWEPGAVPRPRWPERQAGGQAPWTQKSKARTCTRAPGRCFQPGLGSRAGPPPLPAFQDHPSQDVPSRKREGVFFGFFSFIFWPRHAACRILVP